MLDDECAALAVNESPELTVWAVARDGHAKAWVVGGAGGRRERRVVRRFVSKDGSVVDRQNVDKCEEQVDDVDEDYLGEFDDFDGEHAPEAGVDEDCDEIASTVS